MKSSILFFSLVTVALPSVVSAASAASLLQALKDAGASKFAQEIQADPAVLSLYTSSSVQTIYAVPDISYKNGTLTRRQSGAEAQQKQLQVSDKLTELEEHRSDGVIPTDANSPRNRKKQKVVAQPLVNTTDQNPSKFRRAVNGSAPSTPLKIYSGLGKKVNLVRGDIPYDGGLIHIVDGYFTFPVSVADTINQTGLSTLSRLLARANLTDQVTNADEVTIFTPSNAAFAKAGNSTTGAPDAALRNLLLNHIITGFAGYLPLLKDGATYTTLAGSKLTIKVRNGAYFVNGAQIVSPNTITDNGVAHVISSVITPTPPPFIGAAFSLKPVYGLVAAVVIALMMR